MTVVVFILLGIFQIILGGSNKIRFNKKGSRRSLSSAGGLFGGVFFEDVKGNRGGVLGDCAHEKGPRTLSDGAALRDLPSILVSG
jgi:hypothetical protein